MMAQAEKKKGGKRKGAGRKKRIIIGPQSVDSELNSKDSIMLKGGARRGAALLGLPNEK